MALPRALTVKDVAYILNVSTTTVYRLAERGELPGFKVGTKWLFNKEHVDEWMIKQYRRRAEGN